MEENLCQERGIPRSTDEKKEKSCDPILTCEPAGHERKKLLPKKRGSETKKTGDIADVGTSSREAGQNSTAGILTSLRRGSRYFSKKAKKKKKNGGPKNAMQGGCLEPNQKLVLDDQEKPVKDLTRGGKREGFP